MRTLLALLLLLATSAGAAENAPATMPATAPATQPSIFRRDNIAAWCIVPYDGRRRTPEERAEMLERIGLRRFAYDWRGEHLPTFDRELHALAKHHIELIGVWFPDNLGPEARTLLDGLKRHGVKTQLWVTSWGYEKIEASQRVAAAVERMRPIAAEAAAIGCTLGLYNHGGWFGEPENAIAVAEAMKAGGISNVGI